MPIPKKGKYGLKRPEIPANTRVVSLVTGRAGKVAWLCIKASYRVMWDDGTVTTTHESQLTTATK